MTSIKISAIIPTFNSQRFLGYTLMSIKNHVDEIVIMDMSSTDNTRAIVDLCKSSKIRFCSLKDYIIGKQEYNLDYSISYALKLVQGNVVIRVDDDWIWGPEIKKLKEYCQEGLKDHKQGLSCLVYNLITTDSYFLPKWRRPTIMFQDEDNPLMSFGSYQTDNNAVCHQKEIRNDQVSYKRSFYLQTPIRFGHWKFLKDNQKVFIRKWMLFRGETAEEALQKWHFYQQQPTKRCPKCLLDPLYRYSRRFVPFGGFDIKKAIEKELERKKRFEREAKIKMRERKQHENTHTREI